MDVLTALEAAVLDKVLAGDNAILGALRRQAGAAVVRGRDLTGVGFMTALEVPPALPCAPVGHRMLRFGDVAAQIEGLKHGAGFLLYVKDGMLDAIEGYSYDEPWPEHVGDFSLKYMHERQRDFGPLGL